MAEVEEVPKKKSLLRRIGGFISSPATVETTTVGVDEQGTPIPQKIQAKIPSMFGGFIRPPAEEQKRLLSLAAQPAQAALQAKMAAQKMESEALDMALKTAPKTVFLQDMNLGVRIDPLTGKTEQFDLKQPDEIVRFIQSSISQIQNPAIRGQSIDRANAAIAAGRFAEAFKAMDDGIAQDSMDRRDKQAAPTSDMTNYSYAVSQGYKGTFEKWQTDEANRKAPRTTIINQEGKLLTVQEAATLGVPYGTTRAEAFGNSPATEAQKVTGNYASRLKQANDTIAEVEKDIAGMGLLGQGYQKLAPSFMQTTKGQLFDQAKRNFINAVLRRESGAVISESEFSEGDKQYFPQPGDSPEVLTRKRLTRELVTRNFIQAAGNAYQEPGTLQNPNLPNQKRLQSKTAGSEKVVDFSSLPE